MTPKRYNLSIPRLVQRSLSSFDKSSPFVVYWFKSLLQPLQELHYAFLAWSVEMRAEAYSNSQTGVLQYRVNERFDKVQRRITILNNSLNAVTRPAFDFTVQVPLSAGLDTAAVARLVKRYVLVDRSFEVVEV